ncbi:hypothetical protein HPB47_018209 [Ixodes persulcatus]|uniref:Uncharacterized protein n=1 Tax=Ixodes persulcatus TaxID=34615 RepID=A0AC60QPZ2_IXOPE|nr:hypothetical protein HPB47_018209 [Ixodes persulcatus]
MEKDEDSRRSGRISHQLRSLSTICEENRIPARLQRYRPTQLIVVYAWKLFCDQLRKILPTSGSSAADGGRIADSPSPNSNDEEDIAMNHDSNEGEYSELSSEHDSTWIDVVTKAQRRRQRKLNDEVGPTAEPKPPTPLPVRKAAPRPNPLPRDDFKLVLRPQDGLKRANLDIAEVSLALLNSINFTWRQANLRVRLDATQNTATISTPSSDAAKALGNLKQLKIGNTIHMVTLYGLAPDDSSKGLVRGVPLRFSDAEILANSDQSQFEIYTCRRLGQSKMVILTFAGLKVPFFVTLFGGEYPVSLYKKTIPACTVCHEAGHRSTACPQPKVNVCHQCGLKDPHEGHTCEPLCTLCDGPHLTAARGCPKRFSEPYVLRRRALARQARERAVRRDPTPQRGRPRDRSRTPIRRRRSSSGSRSQSTSRSREPRPGASNNKQALRGRPEAAPDEPMDESGPKSKVDRPYSSSESLPSTSCGNTDRPKNTSKKKNAPRIKIDF